MFDLDYEITTAIEHIEEIRDELSAMAKGKTTEQQNLLVDVDFHLLNALDSLTQAKVAVAAL